MPPVSPAPSCGKSVETFLGKGVSLTLPTYVAGVRMDRVDCVKLIERRGGGEIYRGYKGVDLLVFGVLGNQKIADPQGKRTQKARIIYNRRSTGHHICVIDSAGFTGLVSDPVGPAPCLDMWPASLPGTFPFTVSPPAPARPELFAGPAKLLQPQTHDPVAVYGTDLSALDRGTVAHEITRRMLINHLAAKGIKVMEPGPPVTRFDAGWIQPATQNIYIAEVKSLGTAENQQIRLGIGQVLDYRSAVSRSAAAEGRAVVAVVVLEREPSDSRWQDVAEDAGFILTWAPNFPGLV